MTSVTLSLRAMATRFELVLPGDDASHLRAAGEEAMEEIARLDRQLSFYSAMSEISRINARAAEEAVKVEPQLFRLLARAAELSNKTDGAFDVTVAPLLRVWGFVDGDYRVPDPAELGRARELVGVHNVYLNEEDFTVQFDRPGMAIDLGAIGKGYAIERAVESLRDNGISCGLLHGGTSTIYGLGKAESREQRAEGWRIAIRDPYQPEEAESGEPKLERHLDTVELEDASLSVSASHGKSFSDGNIQYGHVLDPRTGECVQSTLLAAVIGPSPTETDALSTALMVLGKDWLATLAERFPGYRGIVADGIIPPPGHKLEL